MTRLLRKLTLICLAAALPLAGVGQVHAAAIVSGFSANTLARNDDGSTGAVGIGFTANFFGNSHTTLFVNNNGNVTFDSPLSAYTPFNLLSTSREIIAPFFSDVDTRAAGNPVTYGSGTFEGHIAFGVNWLDVDYFSGSASHTNRNSFQLLLVDRSDTGAGNFDIIFNYDQIQWETGTFSGGNSSGLGGNSARAGYSNGSTNSFELPGSAVNGAFLDGGPNALISHQLNSGLDGRYIFNARNGSVTTDPPNVVPEPASMTVWGLGAVGMALVGARRRRRAAQAAAA